MAEELPEYTEAAVIADKGVTPDQILDLKGIEGDDSDHYPGVRNVSSAATPLLMEYGSVEGIYAAIDGCEGDAAKRKHRLLSGKTALVSNEAR